MVIRPSICLYVCSCVCTYVYPYVRLSASPCVRMSVLGPGGLILSPFEPGNCPNPSQMRPLRGLRTAHRVHELSEIRTCDVGLEFWLVRPYVRMVLRPSVRLSVCPYVHMSGCPFVRISMYDRVSVRDPRISMYDRVSVRDRHPDVEVSSEIGALAPIERLVYLSM